MKNAQDLSKLGYREIHQLGELLLAYSRNGCDFLGDGVKWEYNPNSDNLFLVDEDYNVGMMNGHNLEQWHNCPNCGAEGFLSDGELIFSEDGETCNNCNS